jgi:hypothetical protein
LLLLSLGSHLRLLVDICWVQGGILLGLARDEGLWVLAFLQFLVPSECLVQVVIHEQTHLHHLLVFEGGYQLKQFRLHVLQRPDQVIDGVVFLLQLYWLGGVDDLVGQVDVPLDEVHVSQ